MTGKPRFRLGVDVGGTHTDLVLLDGESGDIVVEKVASTPSNPAKPLAIATLSFLKRIQTCSQ